MPIRRRAPKISKISPSEFIPSAVIHVYIFVSPFFIISHILLDNNARSAAFGESSFLIVPGRAVSVKTGTTDDKRDNWTVGFTKQITAVVWVGNNDNTPMGGAVSGVSGASPIWNKIIKFALDKSEKGEYGPVEDVHMIMDHLIANWLQYKVLSEQSGVRKR